MPKFSSIKLFSGIILLSIIVIFSIFTFRSQLLYVLIKEHSYRQLLLASQLSSDLVEHAQSVEDYLLLLSQIPEIKSGSTASCNQVFLENSDVVLHHMDNVGRSNLNLVIDCALNTKLIGFDLYDLKLSNIEDLRIKPVLTHSVQSPVVDSKAMVLYIPLFNETKQFTGTLSGAFYFNDIKNNFLSKLRLSRNTLVTIIDDDGEVIYSSNSLLSDQNYWSDNVQQLFAHNAELNDKVKKVFAHELDSVEIKYSQAGEDYVGVIVASDVFPGRRFIVGMVDPASDILASINDVGVRTFLSAVSVMIITVFFLGFGFLYIYIRKM